MKVDPALTVLGVYLHDQRVGTITRLYGDRQVFALDESYIEDPQRPTLSLSLKSRTGGLNTALQQVMRRVPPFFSNLLPEGNLRHYLAAQSGVNPEREFFLLAALGTDLTGAVSVAPLASGGYSDGTPFTVPAAPDAGAVDGPLRFSLAGVQLKFSAMLEASGGLTIPAQGIGGSWIVKLPSQRFESVPENEYVMLELARAAGIDVPRTRLISITGIGNLPAEAARMGGQALAVERFDRAQGGRERIHMEDFAQVFGLYPEAKYKSVSYANIARVLWAEAGPDATYEFIRRIAFSVLIGNADMHLKNWSILYRDRRKATLSPAYDFVATLPYLPEDRLALTFGNARSLTEISADQIRAFVDRAGLLAPPVQRVIAETVDRVTEAWAQLEAKDLLPAALREPIARQIDEAATRTRPHLQKKMR